MNDLNTDALSEFVRQETQSLPFAPLPLHYVAVSKLLLEQYVLVLTLVPLKTFLHLHEFARS